MKRNLDWFETRELTEVMRERIVEKFNSNSTIAVYPTSPSAAVIVALLVGGLGNLYAVENPADCDVMITTNPSSPENRALHYNYQKEIFSPVDEEPKSVGFVYPWEATLFFSAGSCDGEMIALPRACDTEPSDVS